MRRLGNQAFTLLETLIAIGIMMVAFGAILMMESASINTTIKAKQINVVSMLAKNVMVESEHKIEGKAFEDISKEESGRFQPPFEDYSWKRSIKEIKFPSISTSAGGSDGKEGGAADSGDKSMSADMIAKLITSHLSKAVREMTVTISWKKGGGEQSFSASTYWVDLNHAFELSE
jgi:type II secretory pathway pseudopilin PulG